MKIYLREDKLILIKESEDEKVTFYKFFTEVKNFLQDLLDDPINAKPGAFFKNNNISKSTLLNKMLDRDIIKKKENIDEPKDADGKAKSMHYIQYSVPRKNFEQKIKRLYTYFFENEKRKRINESLFDDVKPQKYDSVAVYIFCRDNNGNLCVLAGKRRGYNNGGLYNVPTGQVGDKIYGETVMDAAAREVSEESGIRIDQSLLKDIGDEEYESSYGTCLGKNLMTVLSGTIDNYKPGLGDGENEPFQWIPVTEIRMYQWAFGQDKHIYNITNSL